MRSLALSCVVLYAVVGFVAGACPSSPGQPSPSQPVQHQHHHQPNKPATHALACAWACHASANQSAVDVPSQLVPVWLVATSLFLLDAWISLAQLVLIFARPPPLFSIH
jgi:hypothetical protein